VVRRADAILFATPTNRREYASQYGAQVAEKFFVVPNGCDPDEFAGRSRPADSETFTLLHAGSLYGARSPVPLFEAIASIISKGIVRRDQFRLRLIGTSTLDRDLEQSVSRHNLHDVVERVSRMPRREIVDAMASASALLVLQPGTTVSIPGKLYEYLALGKPVLALCEEGDTAELVRASGAGIAVISPDVRAVEAGLVELLRVRERPLVPAHRDLYDGTRFAGEALAVIAAVAGKRSAVADDGRRATPEAVAAGKASE
jgi:glycosyltransferase involved in cell wall biosynthesis